ncbi:MAG: leucine--tRNA ligase [Treponema sp.]|nr:leucine--tRNA ligase [Treponema sp.]
MAKGPKYPFREIEEKWQKFWEEDRTFRATEDPAFPKEKRAYVLDMFPYPSSQGIHIGHPEGYTATDIFCRYLRASGYNVLHPMGFDSFGLPAENYAIKTGTHPAATTAENIGYMRGQLKALGFSYDWDREVATSSPDYYRWTQWIFLRLFEKGLAYEDEAPINWCPSCKTGLANEEVAGGACDRCGTQVTRRRIRQWMLKITAYAERLLADLDLLDWPEPLKAMQRNWIGRSEGANLRFKVAGSSGAEIEVFTTRPDTLFGATYMVLSPEHPLVEKITTADRRQAVRAYVEAAARKSDLERTDLAKEKTGADTGARAINPATGAEIPVWIADYVLVSYGTGAIMAVPGHDERDREFARAYGLPIAQVVERDDGGAREEGALFAGDGRSINSGEFSGLPTAQAKERIVQWLEKKGAGSKAVNYRLRDWVFSRQRYWGEPIPVVHCPKCGIVALPDSALPLELPDVASYAPTGTGESPLAGIESWVKTACPRCGGRAARETNTMPQWAGSCWYYLRYLDPRNDRALAAPDKIDYWMPVDLYVGGSEHAVLHLLYARFWHKVLYDIGAVETKEPFQRLVNQGMILGEDGQKMSKSAGNGVNPSDVIAESGADALRVYEMFMGPLEASKPWMTAGLVGVSRFLERLWAIGGKAGGDCALPAEEEERLAKAMHRAIKKTSRDTASLDFNTAISAMMVYSAELAKLERAPERLWEPLLIMAAAYAPHLGEELWQMLGREGSVSRAPWPAFDEALTRDEEATIVAQVDGKVRDKFSAQPDTPAAELERRALALAGVQKWIEGREIAKVVSVPGKLVSIVTK